ncbi:Imm42 family immunity protein [Paenibacillus apiarius]|uniref:Immunity 42 family protein n=1 Tax=Paenibacillus apiarius TaxID=46240 RepID=A0ABT4E1G8_9BACL|nr:Imm42 family immunity protein [Paenibacillus apiarius]MCY9517147.1 immunity 42 family protein [Paenibacillus apiarius]MCY9523446.1 immunity 42 family protein [Paenibacillus apiarius]MCY9555082.1 immunity 42 family protein [Paenibacillus apiarius]MCY9561294.1 immunity 42 family protein [Paenibacillus apiarius]MCY9684590.1 immunity 42 family protein [Paenibacillus apiarius]
MIIGKQSHFAVEIALGKEFHGAWLYGKFCFWGGGIRIGNFDIETPLRDILFQMTEILRDSGNRTHEVLYSLDDVELYERLNDALYGFDTSPYDQTALDETWARFNAKINVDVFNEWKIFIVENHGKARMVVKNPKNEMFELMLDSGTFDEVLARAYEELNILYENELQKENRR